MKVIKRNGTQEEVKLDKIINRVKKLCYGLNDNYIDYNKVAITVFNGLYDGVKSEVLDTLCAESAAYLTSTHPDYSILASRIAVSSLHKNTSKSFSQTIKKLYDYHDEKTDLSASLISDEVYNFVIQNKSKLDSHILYDRDFEYDYFGFKTLEKSYLLKINGKIVERPQHLLMRVACGIWCGNIDQVLITYDLLSKKFFTHATPTLFNAGTRNQQLSSCFLLTLSDDSLEHIYDILKDCSTISKYAGGIGLSISKIRASGAYIKGTNGVSNGIIPMLKVFNETARYVDQGGGKRKGSFAIYLEPWHADIYDFLDLRKNNGKEERRARDLFLALWTPDLFMKQVQSDGDWYLFSPDEAPGLDEVYGDEFETLYWKYVEEKKYRKVVKARELLTKIEDSQIETGTPYITFKDACNIKSNQKNLGTIKSSNLCTEIIEYSSADEQAVCNLASIALPMFVLTTENAKPEFDYKGLYDVTYQAAVNLDRVIDVNFYATKETKNSNFRHRPIAIGVQGLADVFALMDLPFDSDIAKTLNREISETMYFAAITASNDLAKEKGTYPSYEGSPASQGLLQYDMWEERTVESKEGKMQITSTRPVQLSGRWDFDTLKENIKLYGLRNSLSIAAMPTASTSQILGNNECFEPYTSNIYKRKTLSGEFAVVNKHLVNDLIKLNLWDQKLKNQIIAYDGSVQNVDIPQNLKDKYKIVYEIKNRDILDMAADRGYFTCQTQSMNLYFQDINYAKLTSALIYGWLKGLKTGIYYTRTQSKVSAIKNLGGDFSQNSAEELSCSIDNPEGCLACGS